MAAAGSIGCADVDYCAESGSGVTSAGGGDADCSGGYVSAESSDIGDTAGSGVAEV